MPSAVIRSDLRAKRNGVWISHVRGAGTLHTGVHLLILALLVVACLSAQEKSIRAVRTENRAITVDGRLDEPQWQTGEVAGDFMQFQPQLGQAATFKTEVRVLTDDRFVYFGVTCHDPEPDRIVPRITRRDGDISTDDAIAIGLDTHMDRRTAYGFFTNVLGTQLDGRLSDNGRTWDTTWDGEWISAGSKTDRGWCAEVAIPFATLKYQPGENMTWGLGLVRFIPRQLETDTWTGPMEDYGRVSQFGFLQGIQLEEIQKKQRIIPHAITRFEEDHETELEVGVDVRYALSQQVSANLTLNPDFAIIEADEEVVNLTRFETFVPEKRNFFLEGSEIYQQRIKLFYSRRIEDIYGGLKLYGKLGKTEFSSMVVQSRPGEAPGDLSANFSVIRVRRDFSRSSNIGFLMASKLQEGRLSGSAGIDIVHFFSEKVNFTGQLCLSYGEFESGNLAFFLRPSYDSATLHFHIRYTHLGENFADNANDVGFITDDNRRELDANLSKTWWIGKHGIDRVQYGSNYNIYWGMDDTLRSWDIYQELAVDLSNRFSFGFEYDSDYKLYEKEFRNHATQLEIGYNTREWQHAAIRCQFGRSFDSDFHLIGAGVHLKLLKSLSLEYSLSRLYLDPDPDNQTKWIHILRLTHYFTKDLFLKFFYQTNTAITKQNVQFVFVYRFQPPFGSIQLAYQKGTSAIGEMSEQGHTLFVKLSYVF